MEIPFRKTNYTCCRIQKQINIILCQSKAPIAKQYICSVCDALYDKIYTSHNACPPTHAPCTKFQAMYCDTCSMSFLSDKCYQNRLTVRAKSKLFCECRRVCRNCSLLWLQILSLNVPRHSAISVTISSYQSVFATSLRSRLASFHIDLCTFCLIRNARKILNSVMDISNSTEQYMCSALLFEVWSNWGLEYRLCTCGTPAHMFRQYQVWQFIEYFRQSRICADKICYFT